jgi:hypothetical protein
MKRSEINLYITEAEEFFKIHNWHLPPFAFLSPEDWVEIIHDPNKKEKYCEIIDKGLGWDVPDFGSGTFLTNGLFLFTIRNGDITGIRDYAEKIMISREDQITPWHFHWEKAEDIINRGGGNLIIEVFHASVEDVLQPHDDWIPGIFDEDRPVQYLHDGVTDEVPAGGKITLTPGESIVLMPRVYHKFYGESEKGTVLVGEVSRVNDDKFDNRFYEELPRFLPIENDEKPRHLLCNEYLHVDEILNENQ